MSVLLSTKPTISGPLSEVPDLFELLSLKPMCARWRVSHYSCSRDFCGISSADGDESVRMLCTPVDPSRCLPPPHAGIRLRRHGDPGRGEADRLCTAKRLLMPSSCLKQVRQGETVQGTQTEEHTTISPKHPSLLLLLLLLLPSLTCFTLPRGRAPPPSYTSFSADSPLLTAPPDL